MCTAKRPVVAAMPLLPYCCRLLSVICEVGCDGLALREFLRLSDSADEVRILDGRTDTVGAAMAIERGHLLS
jgi:hypothetical protein